MGYLDKRPARLLTKPEREAMKRNIEAQLDEYAQAINDFAAWAEAYLHRLKKMASEDSPPRILP
jgi:hypothetical protein